MSDLLQTYTTKIHSEFPEIKYQTSKLITHGWDNHVVILDDAFVFRFPKTDEYKSKFESEVQLLNYLSDKVAISIPNYKYISKDKSFGGYAIISGIELRPELLEAQTNDVKEEIAKSLGDFLTNVHKVPKSVVEKIGIDTEGDYYWSPTYVKKMYEDIKINLYRILREEEVAWIEYQFSNYFASKNEIKRSLIHGDFSKDHIFFNTNTNKVSGIIDFADAEYADTAIDFSYLLDYGEEFIKRVVHFYQGFKDDDFIQRAKFRRLTGMVVNMLRITIGEKMQTTFDEQKLQLNNRMELFPLSK
jgi:aminoglycoside 2''-phosphotransferase